MSTTTVRPKRADPRTRRAGTCVVLAALAAALLPSAPAAAATTSGRLRAVDVTVTERDSAGLVAKVPIRLSRALPRRVTVGYATVAGTAKAGTDFVRTTGKLAIRAGSKRAVVRIPIKGDTKPEPTEKFRVKISRPTGASIADAVAVVTIRDDDVPVAPPPPRETPAPAPSPCPAGSDGLARYIRIHDGGTTEGWTADNLLKLDVELSTPSTLPVCVSWATGDVTAKATSDYTAGAGTLVFTPGEVAKHIGVAVQGDIAAEPDETFKVTLSSPVNASVPYGVAIGTILDDDCAGEDEGMAGAADLGDVLGDVSPSSAATSGQSICTGDVDWYAFDLLEFGGAVDLTAEIRLLVGDAPAQTRGDLDLAVYDATGRLVASSDQPGTEDEVAYVRKSDTSAVDDTRVYVRVFGYQATQVNDYTLTVTGAVPTGIAPNL